MSSEAPGGPTTEPFMLNLLPAPIASAVRESGILKDGGDLGWLQDRRIIDGLLFAYEAHEGKTRKHGTRNRLIHEIFCAHKVYNDPDAQTYLRENGLQPVFGAFCAVMHDIVENVRSAALKAGKPFDLDAVLQRIDAIWSDPFTLPRLHECLDYITDAPSLRGGKRIFAQKFKSFDSKGRCTIPVLQQCLRMYDKLSHVVFDAEEFLAGHISPQQAANCFRQAMLKSFPLRFPVAGKIRSDYIAARSVLWFGMTVADRIKFLSGSVTEAFCLNAHQVLSPTPMGRSVLRAAKTGRNGIYNGFRWVTGLNP